MSKPQTDLPHNHLGSSIPAPIDQPLLNEIVEVGRLGSDPESRERGRDWVSAFIGEVLNGSMVLDRNLLTTIDMRIAQIDELISRQVNEVLHHPRFQALESAWRGLLHLVDRTRWYDGVKVRVLNATKRELFSNHRSAETRSASAMRLIEDCSETLGAEPFSLLVGNYTFSNSPEELELLEHIARIGAAAYTPFLASADPQLFGLASFLQVPAEATLDRKFQSGEYARWSALRRCSEARFATLALPGILLRKPYESGPENDFRHSEGVDGRDHSKFLWGNAAFAVAAQLARAFGKGSWCADPAAFESGGVIQNLPSFEFRTDEGDIGKTGPTEASVSDSGYRRLCDLGFTTVCCDEKSSRAVVFEMPTVYQARDVEDEDGELHRQAPSLLPQVLIQCRVAQYIKCIVREKRGWFDTPGQCARYLNRWAAKYTGVSEGLNSDGQEPPFLKADFQVVKDDRRPDGWFLVKGYVVPNLSKEEACPPVEISVPVLLTRSAANWQPSADIVREDRPERAHPQRIGEQVPQSSQAADPFSALSDRLERLAELRRQQILEEPDYLELKNSILSRMKRLIEPAAEASSQTTQTSGPSGFEVPYAQLHSRIVDLIAEPYLGGAGPKERAQNALSQMHENHAVNSEDVQVLTELLETALADTNEDVAKRLSAVKGIAERIRTSQSASPASKAIADTAEQSGTRALDRSTAEPQASTTSSTLGSKIWRRLVWPDVEGAFSGGAAAAVAYPALAEHYPFAWPLQMAAAFGVVVAAGVRSGVAYGEATDRGAEADSTS